MSTPAAKKVEPEQPPEFPRRVRLGRAQAAGLAVLLSIPVLALCQLLGDRREERVVRLDDVTLTLEYPREARYGNRTQLRLELSAENGNRNRRLRLHLPAAYLDRFNEVRAFPDHAVLAPDGYALELPVPGTGPAAPVFVDLMPEDYGWARGSLRLVLGEREAFVPLETFVYP